MLSVVGCDVVWCVMCFCVVCVFVCLCLCLFMCLVFVWFAWDVSWGVVGCVCV